MSAHMTNEQRQLARRLQASGKSLRNIAKEIGVSTAGAHVMLRGQSREARPDVWTPARGRLAMSQREEIRLGLSHGESLRSIARRLQRSPSTVSREVAANGGREGYRIWPAHQRARACTRRLKAAKLDDPVLCEKVTTWLEEFWSPDEISRRLRREFPHDPTMQISHETIYQSLYVQGRGELRRELARCLRSGRAKRRSQGQSDQGRRLANMVMISERPAEVADRAVPGHWEGDLIIGAGGKECRGNLGGAIDEVCALVALAQGSWSGRGRRSDASCDHDAARRTAAKCHLGPGTRNGESRRLHNRDGGAGVFLRPALAVAKRIE